MDQTDLIAQIRQDEFYAAFARGNAKKLLGQSMSITEQVTKLGRGIELLSGELHARVLENHEDLLTQANHAAKLESVLNVINVHVQNLFANAERLRNQITVPYNALESHTKVLGRLHLASHILRQVNRIQQLSKRLSNTGDPVQKATILHELEQLASDGDLKDVDLVTSELRHIRQQQQKVTKLATGSLNQGLLNENVAQTTTALHIFINLGTVTAVTDDLIEQSLGEFRSSLRRALEGGQAGQAGQAPPAGLSGSQGFRRRVRADVERAFAEDAYHICRHIGFLQVALGGVAAADGGGAQVAQRFWRRMGEALRGELEGAAPAVRQALEEDYPKLLKCYCEMIDKLKFEHFVFDRSVLEKYENAYLSMSLTKMLEPTESMFGGEAFGSPAHDRIDSLMRAITSELSVAIIEDRLSERVAKNVAKTVKMFAVKTEQRVETGPEAAQVIGGSPNAGQQRNVQLANALHYLETQIQRGLSNMRGSLTTCGVAIIDDSLNTLDALVAAILQPLVVSINSVIETIIVTIHLESDWEKVQPPPNNKVAPPTACSPYMKELSHFLSRVYATYLAQFENKEVLTSKCNEISIRCIDLFVRHCSLLRPISRGGRLRLRADFDQLERSLAATVCPQLAELGRPYRLLRSMASLIALEPEQVALSVRGGGSAVRPSTVLLMLFAHAGPHLASPHRNTGWSLPRLSRWLDEHAGEPERLDLVAGALQRYEALVRNSDKENYDPVYPVMAEMLQRALAHHL